MHKTKKLFADYWIFLIIVIQPILDILSYFQDLNIGNSYTWFIRIIILFFIILYTFVKSNNKKRLISIYSMYALFFICHIINLFRVETLNIIEDFKYFILVFQFPIIFYALSDYINTRKEKLNKMKKGLTVSFIIIFFSIFLAFISNTYQNTYTDGGITGWFSSANTISMILCALGPWYIHQASQKNLLIYIVSMLIFFIVLYSNGTKACYLTLIATLVIILFNLIISKKNSKKISKIAITTLFCSLSIFSFKYSITNLRLIDVTNTNNEYKEEININEENLIKENNSKDHTNKENGYSPSDDQENLNISQVETEHLIKKLKTSYIYAELIDIHGEQKVLEALNYNVPTEILSDNRVRKKLNAKIEYTDSDTLTKILGIGYSRIQKNELDLENDITAIFYYYGILGFIIYIALPSCILIRMLISFIKNKKIILDSEFIILGFIIVLLLFGGEYSGAFLRKANANIFLSIYLILAYFKTEKTTKLNDNKITFLLLHLGYGGIESSTINTANALCDKYNIEIISFYKLKENQEKKLNTKINIKFLYKGGPNKEEFIKSLKQKKIINILKEGIKSVEILIKKKFLLIKYIKNCDSKYIVSTRVEFSELLSKYGNKQNIKIAQEHHHHNNNQKYIKKLSKNYKNINYLCALTSSLEEDYKKILKNNKFTKIILLPNMIYEYPDKQTTLKYKNIISVGRLDKGKRIDELIKIFSQIDNKKTNLFIIGDGKEYNNLQSLIKDLKLENRVHLLGFLNKEQIEKYMLKSCLFLMTSISEGLPMVLLEAMSYGVPCIAYETASGTNDIIDDNKNGYIISSRDEKKYIKCINDFLKNNKKMKEFSNNAKQKAKNFSKEQILDKWNSFLR